MKYLLSKALALLMVLACIAVASVLVLIIFYVLFLGIVQLKPSLFAWRYNSQNVSMLPAIINTLFVSLLTMVLAVPVSVGAAIYLSEYARPGKIVSIIRLTADTLAGIPSIVYGLFGYIFFSVFLHWGYSILSGSMTLLLMVLPIIMRTAEEAIIAVPAGMRESSLALGAGKVRTILKVVLPAAMPGILSGVILALGRVLGETAALMYTAGTAGNIASSLFSSGRTLSVHMYTLLSEGLHMEEARAVAVVLLLVSLTLNILSKIAASTVGGKK